MGKSCWKCCGQSCGKSCRESLMVCNGCKNGKKTTNLGNFCNFWHSQEIFKPITTTKTLLNYFYLVEEVLSFNLVGHICENRLTIGFRNAFCSLNTWLRMIYCLQTIHEPACVILTLFQFFLLCIVEFRLQNLPNTDFPKNNAKIKAYITPAMFPFSLKSAPTCTCNVYLKYYKMSRSVIFYVFDEKLCTVTHSPNPIKIFMSNCTIDDADVLSGFSTNYARFIRTVCMRRIR